MDVNVPGAQAVWVDYGLIASEDPEDWGTFIQILRPCGANVEIVIYAIGGGWTLAEFQANPEIFETIFESIEIIDTFGPLVYEASVGPLRLHLPEGLLLTPTLPGAHYVIAAPPLGIPKFSIGVADAFEPVNCDEIIDVPGARIAQLCETREVQDRDDPILRVETHDGTTWLLQGDGVINETFVRAVFDTVTVDESWSRQ